MEKFEHRIREYTSQTIVVGCSGGVDSMVLLHLFHKLDVKLHVVHINYKKRGEASDLDEKLLKEYCESQKIPCSIYPFDAKKYPSGNFQENARNFRYEKLLAVSNGYSTSKIALAHHADDQLETFFMNLSRKSGIMGLACMKEENDAFIRPLLPFSKKEIIEFAVNNEISWREDQSNQNNDYQRNKWRNEFLPFLNKKIPSLEKSVLFLIEKFQEKQLKLEVEANQYLVKVQTNAFLSNQEIENTDEYLQFEIWRMLDQPAHSFQAFSNLIHLAKGKKVEMQNSFLFAMKEENGISFKMKLEEDQIIPALHIEAIQHLPTEFNKECIYLNPEKIKGELKIRNWQNADEISPLGMKGTQLVSDIIKDAKVDQNKKKEIMVVCDDLEIHWIVGLKIGRNSIAKKEDHLIWKVSLV